MRVEHIYRYPVKGLTAEALAETHLDPGETVPGDRRFALAHGDAPFDEAAPEWLQKRHFACLMVNERIAALHASWDERKGVMLIHAPGEAPFAGDTTTEEGRAGIAARLAAFGWLASQTLATAGSNPHAAIDAILPVTGIEIRLDLSRGEVVTGIKTPFGVAHVRQPEFVARKQELLALLQETIERDRAMLEQMEG